VKEFLYVSTIVLLIVTVLVYFTALGNSKLDKLVILLGVLFYGSFIAFVAVAVSS